MAKTGLWSWSRTAATNATVDSTINWAEGQAPSSVNDSARALMAATAMWRDDMSGSITTTGTSTAYTVAAFETFDALTAGMTIGFAPHTTNGATVTLNVNSLGAKPLRSAPGSAGELGAGVLVQGTPYVATYYTSNSGEWILQGFYGNPFNIPIGGMMMYVGTTAPNSNFVLPYGQAISRSTYATLFGITSTTWGTGDGSTTFNLPDIRGRAPFGLGNMGGSDAGRITVAGGNWDGTILESTSRGGQTHTILQTNLPNVNFTNSGITVGIGTISVALQANGAAGNTADPNGKTLGAFSGSILGYNSNAADRQMSASSIGVGGSPSITAQGSAASGGSGTALTIMPPALVLPFILRII